MSAKQKQDVEAMLFRAYRKGVEDAIDLSARTGIPLVVEKNGKIKRITPNYKYVRVAVETSTDKKSRKDSSK